MKLFSSKLLLFVLLVFLSDFLLGHILGELYLQSKDANTENINYGFVNYDNDDILFFGASEVKCSIISNRVSDETGLSSHNFSKAGHGIYFNYPLLETILNIKKEPKVILISAYSLLDEGQPNYLSSTFPYYKENQHVKKIVDHALPLEFIKLTFQGYVYNSKFFSIFNNDNRTNLKGYGPKYPRNDITQKNILEELTESTRDWKVSNDIKAYYVKFLERAVSSGATVYVYIPPAREKVNQQWINTVKSLTEDAGAKLMDFSKDYSIINNKSIWKDKIHLYNDGAIILTDKIIKIMKQDNVF